MLRGVCASGKTVGVVVGSGGEPDAATSSDPPKWRIEGTAALLNESPHAPLPVVALSRMPGMMRWRCVRTGL
jgi:hypothetical protein